jgi:hypothetical protein
MSYKIKDLILVDELTTTTKFPIGNVDDTALATNMQQIIEKVGNEVNIGYSQITDAPEINDATITIKQGGTTKGTFTLNQASDGIIELDTGGGGGGGGDTVYWDDIEDKPNFATVATSGSYNDLTDTPTIGNGTLTIKQGGTTMGTFTANSTENVTINLSSGGGGGSVAWGDITGTVSNQTDLQNILDGKYPTQETITSSSTNVTVAVLAGKIYKYTAPLTSLTISSIVDSQFETDIYFTTASSCTLSLPSSANAVVGSTTLLGNTKYIIAVKDNSIVIGYDGFTGVVGSTDWSDITNKPNFATVATSGSYNDLTNKPTIPAAQVNSDWNASSGVAEILNKPNLATVATSGDYTDLTNTPTIPTVNDATITFTQGGVTKGSFTINQSSDATIALDAGGGGGGSAARGSITGTLSDQTDLQSALDAKTPVQTTTTGSTSTVTVAVQGGKIYSYSTPLTSLTLSSVENSQYETDIYFTTDTACTLSIPNTVRSIIGSTTLIGNTDYTIVIKDNNVIIGFEGYTSGSVAWNDVTGKPTFATVATSGSYTDLSNTPSLATVATSGSYNDLSNTPTIPAAPVQSDWNESDTSSLAYIANKPTIPASPVQSDWNETSTSSLAYIANKPTIPDAPVQTDWTEYDTTSLAYLANKPQWFRNVQNWTIDDTDTTSKNVPVYANNQYSLGLGVNRIIAPAYGQTATTNLLTIDTTDSQGANVTTTIMNVGTNGVYAPAFYENGTALTSKYVQQSNVTTETWTFTLSDNTTITRTVYLQPSI